MQTPAQIPALETGPFFPGEKFLCAPKHSANT